MSSYILSLYFTSSAVFDHEPSTKLRFGNDGECGGRVSLVSFA